jgi:hypothetical protein
MRIEHVIAAVARPVAVATVREIKAVVSFVRQACLHHLWLQRMPMGMPAYALVLSTTPTTDGRCGGSKRDRHGKQCRNLLSRPKGDSAFCPAGF